MGKPMEKSRTEVLVCILHVMCDNQKSSNTEDGPHSHLLSKTYTTHP